MDILAWENEKTAMVKTGELYQVFYNQGIIGTGEKPLFAIREAAKNPFWICPINLLSLAMETI